MSARVIRPQTRLMDQEFIKVADKHHPREC